MPYTRAQINKEFKGDVINRQNVREWLTSIDIGGSNLENGLNNLFSENRTFESITKFVQKIEDLVVNGGDKNNILSIEELEDVFGSNKNNNQSSQPVRNTSKSFIEAKQSPIKDAILKFTGGTETSTQPEEITISLAKDAILRFAGGTGFIQPKKTPVKDETSSAGTEDAKIISPIPTDIISKYGINNTSGFYNKYVSAKGLPIFASANMDDKGILETVTLVNKLLENHPDILKTLIDNNQKIILLDFPNEKINSIPELTETFKDAKDGTLNFFTYMGIPGQKGEAVIVSSSPQYVMHELGHAIGMNALPTLDSDFSKKLAELYESEKTKFKDYYASVNKEEFWAEIVTLYHGEIALQMDSTAESLKGKDDLKKISPKSHDFVETYFG